MSHEPTRLMACERARGGQCIRVAVHRGSPRERWTEKREKMLFRPVSRVWHPYCTISAPTPVRRCAPWSLVLLLGPDRARGSVLGGWIAWCVSSFKVWDRGKETWHVRLTATRPAGVPSGRSARTRTHTAGRPPPGLRPRALARTTAPNVTGRYIDDYYEPPTSRYTRELSVGPAGHRPHRTARRAEHTAHATRAEHTAHATRAGTRRTPRFSVCELVKRD